LDNINELDFINLTENFPNLEISQSPFTKVETIIFDLLLDDADLPFGLSFAHCERLCHPFISDIQQSPTARQSLRTFRKKYLGAYLLAIDDHLIFCLPDITACIHRFLSLRDPPRQVVLTLAPERIRDLSDNAPPPLHLRRLDLEHIQRLKDSIPTDLHALPICRLQTDGMTPEERAWPKLTRHHLKKLPNWPTWDEAFDAQLCSSP
jgi:hypothetical protein